MRQPHCELRPGIGPCDECNLPKWPQEYVGYGFMVCLDCLIRLESEIKNEINISSTPRMAQDKQANQRSCCNEIKRAT